MAQKNSIQREKEKLDHEVLVHCLTSDYVYETLYDYGEDQILTNVLIDSYVAFNKDDCSHERHLATVSIYIKELNLFIPANTYIIEAWNDNIRGVYVDDNQEARKI